MAIEQVEGFTFLLLLKKMIIVHQGCVYFIKYILTCIYFCDGKAEFSAASYSSLQCHTIIQKSF